MRNKIIKYQCMIWALIFSTVLPIVVNSEDRQTIKKPANEKNNPVEQPVKSNSNLDKSDLYSMIYIPPKPEKAAPHVRTTAGGSRGGGHGFPIVTLLVPEHTGITYQTQPTLYWHISEPTERKVVISIIDPTQIHPVLESIENVPVNAGTHAIALAEHGIGLMVGTSYEWSVSVIMDTGKPSGNLIARGFIEVHKPSVKFLRHMLQASTLEKARLYAKKSVWYDALSTLFKYQSDNIKERKKLLQQVGLVQDEYVTVTPWRPEALR